MSEGSPMRGVVRRGYLEPTMKNRTKVQAGGPRAVLWIV